MPDFPHKLTADQIDKMICETVDETMDRIGVRKVDMQTREMFKPFVSAGINKGSQAQSKLIDDITNFSLNVLMEIRDSGYVVSDKNKEHIDFIANMVGVNSNEKK